MKDFIKTWRELDIPDTSHLKPGVRGKFYDPNRPPAIHVPRREPWLVSFFAVLGMVINGLLQDLRAGGRKLVRSVIHLRRPRPRPRHGK